MSSVNSLLTRSTSGVSVLILGQVFTKLVTFVLNQLLIRYISPQTFGISVYLEFLVNSVLFFSREGERLAIQRTENLGHDQKFDDKLYHDKSDLGKLQSIVNFGFIPIIIGIPISFIIGLWQYKSVDSSLFAIPYINYTFSTLVVAILLELLIEPIYSINQYELNFKIRSKFEGLAIFVKCIVTFVGIMYLNQTLNNSPGLAILCFALGQLSYALILFGCYMYNFANFKQIHYSIEKIWVTKDNYYYFNPQILKIWKNLFIQMIFKHFLTEGDKLIINYWINVEQQAVFAVVSNYGSILARLFFQPIEESMRLLFTRILSQPSQDSQIRSLNILSNLSIFYLNLSVLLVLGGITNGSFLLKNVLGGSKADQWKNSNIFEIFPQYIGYLTLMAFNGIYEAFFLAIATNNQIQKFSYFMSISCLIVIGISYLTIYKLQMGLTGLIIANLINMILRISYCSIQIKKYYRDKINIKITVISGLKYIIIYTIFQSIQLYFNKTWFSENFKQFFTSVGVCLLCLLVQVLQERKRILAMIKPKRE